MKVTIWKVEGDREFYTASVARVYRDREGNWQERASFSLYELGRVITLLGEAKGLMEQQTKYRSQPSGKAVGG